MNPFELNPDAAATSDPFNNVDIDLKPFELDPGAAATFSNADIDWDSFELNPDAAATSDPFNNVDIDLKPFELDPGAAAKSDGFNNADIGWEHFDFDLDAATVASKQTVAEPARPSRSRHPFGKQKPAVTVTQDQRSGCLRCGRSSHVAKACYARCHISGRYLG